MRAKKWVYICDHCGKIALEETYCCFTDVWKDLPEHWHRLGKEDLCPECYEIYLKFKNEVKNKKEDILTKNCTFRKNWIP